MQLAFLVYLAVSFAPEVYGSPNSQSIGGRLSLHAVNKDGGRTWASNWTRVTSASLNIPGAVRELAQGGLSPGPKTSNKAPEIAHSLSKVKVPGPESRCPILCGVPDGQLKMIGN
jgi:hypothetical protein